MRLVAIALLLSSCSMAEIRTWSLHDYDLECYEVERDWDGKARICSNEVERDRSLYGRD